MTTSGVNRNAAARCVEAAQQRIGRVSVGAYRTPSDVVKSSAGHDRPTTAMAYGVNDAATLLGVSRWTLYELLRRGEIRSFKVAGRRLVSVQAIVDYIADAESEGYATSELDGL